MKQTKSASLPHYQELIQSATRASEEALPILEKIMREEVFHSTLDWQSPEQFRKGALKALEIYHEDQPFYDAEQLAHQTRWQAHLARTAFDEAKQTGSERKMKAAEVRLAQAVQAEQKAALAFDRFLSPICRTLTN